MLRTEKIRKPNFETLIQIQKISICNFYSYTDKLNSNNIL